MLTTVDISATQYINVKTVITLQSLHDVGSFFHCSGLMVHLAPLILDKEIKEYNIMVDRVVMSRDTCSR